MALRLAMNLAIFDIDGTLTETNHVDDVCFVQALADAYAITDISTDWSAYPHTTDSAILSYVFREHLSRPLEEADLLKFKNCFVSLLQDYQAKDPSLFAEVPGASSCLRRLNQEPEWRVAIASGAWFDSAALKLKAATIAVDDFPGAFADEAISREEILELAVVKAKARYGVSEFSKIVSVGDGLWDVRTARNLNFSFLGIGRGAAKDKLQRAGATHVLEDLADYCESIGGLEQADVPREAQATT